MRWAFLLLAIMSIGSKLTPEQAVSIAVLDAAKLPVEQAIDTRYLYLPESSEKSVKVIDFCLNSISKSAPISHARPVVKGHLWAVQMTDYKWNREIWERMKDEPYFHREIEVEEYEEYGYREGGKFVVTRRVKTGKKKKQLALSLPTNPKAIASLAEKTGSNVPIVRADWFVQAVMTPRDLLRNKETSYNYHEWLGLKSRDDVVKLALLHKDEVYQESVKAAIDGANKKSGVSRGDRQILRLPTSRGGYWVTLDAGNPTGSGNAIENLRDGEYKHDAEEHYFFLPNRLFGYFLSDDKGNRQDFAPSNIVGSDDSPFRLSRDANVYTGLSCVRCHTDGLRSIDDYVRRVIREPVRLTTINGKVINKEEAILLRQQYFSNLTEHLEDDRRIFARAVKYCNGLTVEENATEFAKFYNRYAEEGLSLNRAAAEWGVEPEKLLLIFRKYSESTADLPNDLGGFLRVFVDEAFDPDTPLIGRSKFEFRYQTGLDILSGYRPAP